MNGVTLAAKAALLRSYHDPGQVLILPNAWDVASAVVLARAGARAIATTSAGVSWSLGRPDGHGLTREDMAAAIGRIAAAVDVPVTADIEGGYGYTPDDAARTVAAVVAAGAAGINLEDAVYTKAAAAAGGPLLDIAAQAERIRAARAAASYAGLPELVINARTDVYLRQVGDPAGRLDEVLARAASYAEAGADCLFVPFLLDLATLATLAAAVPLPINAMALAGGPSVAQLSQAGVRRVSVGTAIAQAAYTAADRAARELLGEGTYGFAMGALSPIDLNSWFQ
jgi:2-methylisocitrate lyase-like PEP mutase family enzyme